MLITTKKIHDSFEFVLLYPDGSEVVTLPGSTTEEFVLQKYREDVGKNYNRLTLFIATKSDYLFAEMPDFDDVESDDDDGEPEGPDDTELEHSIYDAKTTSTGGNTSTSTSTNISASGGSQYQEANQVEVIDIIDQPGPSSGKWLQSC